MQQQQNGSVLGSNGFEKGIFYLCALLTRKREMPFQVRYLVSRAISPLPLLKYIMLLYYVNVVFFWLLWCYVVSALQCYEMRGENKRIIIP